MVECQHNVKVAYQSKFTCRVVTCEMPTDYAVHFHEAEEKAHFEGII